MKKGGICIVLLIMLATGCQTAVIMDPHITTEQQTARNGSSTTVSTEEIIIYDDTTGNITLSGESLGKNRVKFSWILSEDASSTEKLRLIRDEEPYPIYDEKNYWFQVHESMHEVIWIDLPTGDHHFRICTFENNHCVQYSNNLPLYVK